MAVSWYPDKLPIIDVSNPGHGEINIYGGPTDVERLLRGPELGQVLQELTALALALDDPDRNLPWPAAAEGAPPAPRMVLGFGMLSREQARVLLPVWQAAVLYAAAGSNRADTVLGEEIPPAFCHRCNHGSYYTGDASSNEWCDQHGHSWFGGLTPDRARSL